MLKKNDFGRFLKWAKLNGRRVSNKLNSGGHSVTAQVILNGYQKLIPFLNKNLNDNELDAFSHALLTILAHLEFKNGARTQSFFDRAESAGFHVTPVHFYSPIPSKIDIDEANFTWRFDQVPNLRVDQNELTAFMKKLVPYFSELSDIFLLEDSQSGDFFWNNSAFCPIDACIYYSMIRYLRPNRIIEIGSGFSTFIATKALQKNQSGTLECIEPYPTPMLMKLEKDGLVRLNVAKVQNVPLEKFSSLERNDILFIDSSHVTKVGSDVNFEVFQILPALKAGVWTHFHDIFHPFDYPKSWLNVHHLFWNEQYLVLAFLAYNAKFKMRMSGNLNNLLVRELYSCSMPFSEGLQVDSGPGGSLWVEGL